MLRSSAPIDRRAAARFAALLVLPAILAVAAAPVRAQAVRDNLWVTDGQVISEAVSGNTLYLGGDFTRVGPAVGGWAPLDSLGNWVPPAPLVSGSVYGRDAAGRSVPAGVYLVHARSAAWEANGRVVRMR